MKPCVHALRDVPHTCARAATEPVERVRLPQHLVAKLARGGVEGGAAESFMVGEGHVRADARPARSSQCYGLRDRLAGTHMTAACNVDRRDVPVVTQAG